MIKCPKCGFLENDEMNFCSQCGSKLLILCPKCGTPNSSDNTLCTSCGVVLEIAAPTIVVPAPRPAPRVKTLEEIAQKEQEEHEHREARRNKVRGAFQWVAFGLIAVFIIISLSVFWYEWFDFSYNASPFRAIYESTTSGSVTIVALIKAVFSSSGSTMFLNNAQATMATISSVTHVLMALTVIVSTFVLTGFFLKLVIKRDFSLTKFKNLFSSYYIVLILVAALSSFDGFSFVVPFTLATIITIFLFIVCFVIEHKPVSRPRFALNIVTIVFSMLILFTVISNGVYLDFATSTPVLPIFRGVYSGLDLLFLVINFQTVEIDAFGQLSSQAAEITALMYFCIALVILTAIAYCFYFSQLFKDAQALGKKMAIANILVIALTFITYAVVQSTVIVIRGFKAEALIAAFIGFDIDFGWLAYTPFLISIIGVLNLISYTRERTNAKNN